MKKITKIILVSVLLATFLTTCSVINTLTNLKRIQFKVENVNNFQVAGVPLSGKTGIKDLNITNTLQLSQIFTQHKFPAQFVLNLAALNPNDGQTTQTKANATITNLEWRLILDDTPTVSGVISNPIQIPATGQSVIIPLTIQLDLYEFFGNQGYDKLLNLAFALGGAQSDLNRVKLDIKPTVQTPLGPIPYPGRITVINKQFSN
ncbi:MAG: hypothetical protein ABFD61_03255 [Chloroherpetonaceae bacterium]